MKSERSSPKASMEIVGFLLERLRTLARILDIERGGHHQHVAQNAQLRAGEDHATDARVDREARELSAERRELALLAERAELLEHAIALGDGLGLRRIEGRETPRRRRGRATSCAG